MSTVGDILSTVGDILSTVRGYLEYCGVIMSTMRVIKYCGGVQYRGGYHGYHGGCSVP